MLSILRKFLGFVLIIAGIVAGFYVGFWLCFVGGIIQMVTTCKLPIIPATGIAWGVGKIVLSGFFGSVCFVVISGLGISLLE